MAIKLPTPSNVPQVGLQQDPGLQIPTTQTGAAIETAGAAISGIGDKLIAADVRTRNRQDTVDRARAIRGFNTAANEELRRIETEEDFSNPATSTDFGAFLKKAQDDTLGSHAGSEDSRAALTQRLEDIRFSVGDKAAVRSVAAQRALVQDSLAADIDNVVLTASQDPTNVEAALKAVETHVNDMGAALTQNEIRDNIQAGQRKVATSAVGAMIASGNIEGAQEFIKKTGSKELLGSEGLLKVQTRIRKFEKELRAGEIAGEQALAKVRAILGDDVPITPEMRLSIAGLSDKRSTPQQKLDGINSALAANDLPPLTPAQTQKALGVEAAETGTDFGKGLTGSAFNVANELANSVSSGLASQEDLNEFASAFAILSRPIQFTNPDTGLIETRILPIPGFITNAARSAGIEQPGQQAAPTTPTNIVPEELQVEEEAAAGGTTIFEKLTQATGPGPGLQRFAGGLPVVGEFFGAENQIQIAKELELASNTLVNVLRRSPRFAETERSELLKQFSVDPKVFSNPGAAQAELTGLDNGLRDRLQEAQGIIDATTTTRQARRIAIDERNAIENFREQLGIPVTVGTVEEANQLPPGTAFFDPAGVLRQVPQAAPIEPEQTGTL